MQAVVLACLAPVASADVTVAANDNNNNGITYIIKLKQTVTQLVTPPRPTSQVLSLNVGKPA